MKIVINDCYGGFGLSHEAIMYYAGLGGFDLYAFVNQRDDSGHLDFHKCKSYKEGEDASIIYYAKEPLNEDGIYNEKAWFSASDIERNDANLIKTVEDMGEKANGRCASLKIIEIPEDVEWGIEEYDGVEWVAEKHRTWS